MEFVYLIKKKQYDQNKIVEQCKLPTVWSSLLKVKKNLEKRMEQQMPNYT